MLIKKINIYNPVTKKGFEQEVSLIMEPAIEAMYLELKNNHEALFKHKELLSLEPVGMKHFTMEITGYEGTALYKIFHENDLVVLGEIFTSDEEVEKFSKDLVPELEEAYNKIPNAPVATITFAKDFYKVGRIMQETLFSFCRLLGFSAIRVLLDEEKEKQKIGV